MAQKRSHPDPSSSIPPLPKRQRIQQAREINVQQQLKWPASIDIEKFTEVLHSLSATHLLTNPLIQARGFEIQSMEIALNSAKYFPSVLSIPIP
jgi:hypothetical protein